jgi:hypothetical protein
MSRGAAVSYQKHIFTYQSNINKITWNTRKQLCEAENILKL